AAWTRGLGRFAAIWAPNRPTLTRTHTHTLPKLQFGLLRRVPPRRLRERRPAGALASTVPQSPLASSVALLRAGLLGGGRMLFGGLQLPLALQGATLADAREDEQPDHQQDQRDDGK